MKIQIPDVSIIYANEDSGINITATVVNDFENLQFNFIGANEERYRGKTLNKSQVLLLTDTLNLIIKNKLIKL